MRPRRADSSEVRVQTETVEAAAALADILRLV